ncbi:MAG: cobyrinate a,c-diamide synthase [Clostridiaceae bacterium]|nr:cobyrinate a,c-diamide synthase [Clostridiaceae bacterium]
MDRVLIAGTHSGCGKTTVTTALLCALRARKATVNAFKCGPDYIDPMFHREAIGIPSQNLDPYFSTGAQLRAQLSGPGLAVIEGVMGYYDGIGTEGLASTWQAAAETETPAVLVIDPRGMYTSAGAVLKGFLTFRRESGLRGVIFNNTPPEMYPGLRRIAEDAGIKAFGFLPRDGRISVGSRHLGLITAGELSNLKEKLNVLGALAEEHLDIDGLLTLAAEAPALSMSSPHPAFGCRVRIAVAQDEAFCFMYEENLSLLRAMGAEIVPFSPLRDGGLPEKIGGLWLPGGYPELYLDTLSANVIMCRAVQAAVESGLPTIAECGGFLYLHDMLDGIPMAGVFHARAYRMEKLRRFGYTELRAGHDNLLCRTGESIRAHEFHYYDSEDCGDDFTAEKPGGGRSWPCVHATETLYAGFPHLYFPANPAFAENFLRKACDYDRIHN